MLESVSFNKDGLVPVIAQDAGSAAILMMAWMDRAALEQTVKTGRATYYSRSRQRSWTKGERSGHSQEVVEIRLDCDGDTVLLKVHQKGGIACHTGRAHCFYRRLGADGQWVEDEPVLRTPEAMYGE